MDDNIVRYVLVDDGFGDRSWYIDETDSVEERDFVLVPYGIDEKRGFAATVVRCIPPYTPYPLAKTKPIFEVTERRGKPKAL